MGMAIKERSDGMSSSLIRCLLAVLSLSQAYEIVASKDVARLLGVKRPTVHRSLEILREKGVLDKAPYGDIRLTESGRALAKEMEERRDDLTLLFSRKFGLTPEESIRAALILMSELKEESLARLCLRRD